MRLRLLFLVLASVPAAVGQARDADFDKLADGFFNEVVFRYDPASATAAGFHQFDSLLPSMSSAEIQAEIADYRKFEQIVQDFNPQGLSPWAAADRELALAQIRSQLLSLETIHNWTKNPDLYSSNVTGAIFVIMSRSFAPPEERLKSIIARERLIPRVFQSARGNLKNPPRIYTEVAIKQLPGIADFFKNDVPKAFQKVTDKSVLADFENSNTQTIRALQEYEAFLKNDLLPRSNGDFRIGAENFRRQLLYDEMVDTPLDRLLAIGYANLRANQQEFQRVAAKIDPKRTPQQIREEAEKDHPRANQLLEAFRDVLSSARSYIEAHQIVTIPSTVPPIVEETPPFLRALTSASMDTPGPYERVAKEAFFNVTLPEQVWTKQQTEQYLEGFNRGTIISITVHEVYPGHYVQFQWLPHVRTKIRKLMSCASNAEGWAHYSEQMMLDEGYGNGDPKLRLGQLQAALLRNARFIAGIEMHTGKMTVAEATDFFVNEGYQVRPMAEKEAKRGTFNPTYLVYTLGKLEILKLRADYRKMKGAQFSLQAFHDAFLQQGTPPIKIVRRALLGDDSPVL